MPNRDIIEALLRYHRKNPLRVAFGTQVLIAQHGIDAVEEAYQHLLARGLVEPMKHTVEREGQPCECYRITKQGVNADDDEVFAPIESKSEADTDAGEGGDANAVAESSSDHAEPEPAEAKAG